MKTEGTFTDGALGVEPKDPIWTRLHACPAAIASCFVDQYDPVLSLVDGFRWTGQKACWPPAMAADLWKVMHADVWIFTLRRIGVWAPYGFDVDP